MFAAWCTLVVYVVVYSVDVLQVEIYPMTPYRNTSYEFQQYQLGVGGPCEHFVPPAGETLPPLGTRPLLQLLCLYSYH